MKFQIWLFSKLSLMLAIAVVLRPILAQPQLLDPDIGTSFTELVRSRGFLVESHDVPTEDGYVLTLYRIGHPALTRTRHKLRPVILKHCLFQSSMDFVINSPFLYSKKSKASNATTIDPQETDYLGDNLGFDLALTKRYDVWVANSRGIHRPGGYGHLNITSRNPKFWAFSYEEMARYDLPAVIDYVRLSTGRKTVGYVGYSQGTTLSYVLLSMRPEYGEILQPVISLAPMAYLSNIQTPLRFLAPLLSTYLCKSDAQLPLTGELLRRISLFCPHELCSNLLFLADGFDPKHMNKTRLPVYFSQMPTPSSRRDLCHSYQNYQTGRFARYDFGSAEKNIARYGSQTPPEYPLEKISNNATLAFIIGQNDFLSTRTDLDKFKYQLSRVSKARVVLDYVVPDPQWNHGDFVFGTDAGVLVYSKVIEVLDKYTRD